MEKPTLAEVKKKFQVWRRNNKGEGMLPRYMKRQAVTLLEAYSKVRLAKELGVTESSLRAWQRRILELEHDAGMLDTKIFEMGPRGQHQEGPAKFVELSDMNSDGANAAGRPSLLLRRPDGAILSVKGELSMTQIKALTMIFLGDEFVS